MWTKFWYYVLTTSPCIASWEQRSHFSMGSFRVLEIISRYYIRWGPWFQNNLMIYFLFNRFRIQNASPAIITVLYGSHFSLIHNKKLCRDVPYRKIVRALLHLFNIIRPYTLHMLQATSQGSCNYLQRHCGSSVTRPSSYSRASCRSVHFTRRRNHFVSPHILVQAGGWEAVSKINQWLPIHVPRRLNQLAVQESNSDFAGRHWGQVCDTFSLRLRGALV